jgi:CHAD domain-containing protein
MEIELDSRQLAVTPPASLDALLAVFDQRVEHFWQELSRCQQGFSEEAVHDLRVSIRRLLSLLDLLGGLPDPVPVKKLRRRLKAQLTSMGALRDVQVMLAAVQSIETPLLGQQAFTTYLMGLEQQQREQARQTLNCFPAGKVFRRLNIARKALQVPGTNRNWYEALLAAVEGAFTECSTRYLAVRRTNPETVHSVRIAFKRFRYSVEIIEQVRPACSEAYFHALRHYQTLLGNIQDADVLLKALEDFAKEHAATDVVALLRYADQRRTACISEYWRQKEKLAALRFPASTVGRV